MNPEEIAEHYEASHQRIVELVRSLSGDQVATPVPGTPAWDVHDVLAHLAAIPTDALAGRITGIPTDEFTAEQIATRKAATVEDLIDEWTANMPTMLEVARAGLVPPNLAVDAITHEQDIRGAVDAGRVPDAAAIRLSVGLYFRGFAAGIKKRGAPALRVCASDADFDKVAGEGDAAATLRASEYELFRTLAGRRGRDAVLGLEWDGDPSPYLDCLNVFGELPAYVVAD